MRRWLLIAVVVLGLAPGVALRSTVELSPRSLTITADPLAQRDRIGDALSVTGLWELEAPHPFFGGFSALVWGDGELIVGSDRGWLMHLPLKTTAKGPQPDANLARFSYYTKSRKSYREMNDLEALAYDRESGTLWSAYEQLQTVLREEASGRSTYRDPPEMARWPSNSGPETMVRLSDGRFIIIGEGQVDRGSQTFPALLFVGDPVAMRDPMPFTLAAPRDFAPVDATQLPGGDVLILLRRVELTIPAVFDAAIMRANPEEIAENGEWSGPIIARLGGDVLGENFEGIAHVPAPDGSEGTIFLVADDNFSLFQRNLLARVEFAPPPGEGE